MSVTSSLRNSQIEELERLRALPDDKGNYAYADGKWTDGNFGIRTGLELARFWTAGRELGDFPRKDKHVQWPGSGKPGDPIFDNFIRTQVQFAGESTNLAVPAGVALLDMIGTPVILLTHSQGGGFGWTIADRRPNLVKAIVTLEAAGPPIKGVDTAKVAYQQGGGLSWGVTATPITYEVPPPLLGQHTDEVLTGLLGVGAEEIAKLKAEGRFTTLRVLQGAQEPVSVIDGSPVANLNNQNNQTVNDRSTTLAQTGIAPNLAFLFPAPTQSTDASGTPVPTSTQSNVLCMSGAEMLGSCKSFASRVKTYWKESDVP